MRRKARTTIAMVMKGSSQQSVLNHLLEQKEGATLDEIMNAVGLSRTAVNQHLVVLEKDGFIRKAEPRKTGGRPQHVYVLTEDGANRFPKQYSWFSKMLIETLRQQIGPDKVSEYMYDLGVQLSAQLIPRLVGLNRTERINEIVKIMNETGFVARTIAANGGEKIPRVECKNCVYHDLSKNYPEVCRFDIGFLSGLMGAEVEHQACMQRGGQACRFRFIPPA
jgi:DeoR family transcriptional regulator, suf operon transcriptional repressor